MVKFLIILPILFFVSTSHASAFNYQQVTGKEFHYRLLQVTNGPKQSLVDGKTPAGDQCNVWYNVGEIRDYTGPQDYPDIDIRNSAKFEDKDWPGYFRPIGEYWFAQNGKEYSFVFYGGPGIYKSWMRLDITKVKGGLFKSTYALKIYYNGMQLIKTTMPKAYREETGICMVKM